MSKYMLGIFGGTFDPIHFGHLRAALEIKEQFNLDEIRFIPCKIPPHRKQPKTSTEDRIHMLKLATQNSDIIVDLQEMEREGPSYSIDTLQALHTKFPKATLCMIIGIDAFMHLYTWHQWEKLLDFSNIIVITRQNEPLPNQGIMHNFWQNYSLKKGERLNDFSKGRIVLHNITRLDISGFHIRNIILNGESPRFLLPDDVWKYIQKNNLYGYNESKIVKRLEETKR